MDKDLKNYYQKQMCEITNQINCCDYTDNRELIEIIGKLADMVQSILHEL
jgi:hypothetical protein